MLRTYQVHGRTPADPRGPPRTPDAVRFLCEPKGGALSQELGSMILTLILDFSEQFVSLSHAAATTARGTFAAATTAHGTFAVSAHAALRRCRTRRRPAFLAISTDSRNFNSPRKLEMRRSRFSGTTDGAELLAERTSFWFAEETNCIEIGPERPQRPSNCAIRARC